MCLGNFYQKENFHSFTTPHVCPTKAICWPSWYKSLHICALLLHWASSSFVTLVRCPFILVWSRSCALHQLNFYTGSQLCHSIHPQNKTPCLMISLSSILQMRHVLLKKREREKMACPRSMTQKKMDTSMPMKKRMKKIVILPCPHVIQIKGREIHKRSIPFPSSTIHLPHMYTILIILFDLSPPQILCLILQYMWHKCMLPLLLPWAPHKPYLEVGWKQAMPWWGYIYTMSNMRDPMEK